MAIVMTAETVTQVVPSIDSAENKFLNDVVGNKSDTSAGTSLVGLVKAISTGNAVVPAQNAAANTNQADVVGNKTDTVAGTSIVSLILKNAALLAVPTQDLATDTGTHHVVGKKSDTTSGTSLVSLAKQNAALHVCPAADAVTDTNMRDVVGLKADTTAGTSLMAVSKQLKAVLLSAQKYSPTGAAGVSITSGTGAYTLGTLTQVVAANAIAAQYAIVGLHVESMTSDLYEFVIYQGGSDVEVARVKTGTVGYFPCSTPIIAANARIKVASLSAVGARAAAVSIAYVLV